MTRSRSDYFLNGSILCLMLSLLFYRLSRTEADPDLWGHVRFGQDVLREARLTSIDPYSYVTEGCKWINHEWLTETLFGFVFNQFGATGLVCLKLAVVVTILGILYVYLSTLGYKVLHAFMVLILTTIMLIPGVQTIRPHLFTYVFFMLTLLVLKKADEKKYLYLFCLPPIFALWVNMHGGFLAGLTVLFAWAIAHIAGELLSPKFSIRNSQLGLIVGALFLSLCAVLVNPYGVELIAFLLRTATGSRPDIMEWTPLSIVSLSGVAYLLTVGITVLSVFSGRSIDKPALLLVWAFMAISPLIASRHLELFAIATVIICAEPIALWWQRYDVTFSKEGFANYSIGFKSFLIALFLAGSAYFLSRAIPVWSTIKIVDCYPLKVVELLRKVHARGNIANGYDDGEYLIYKLGPALKVSLDGRRETIYPDKAYLENWAFQDGLGNWEELLKNYHTDMVLAGKARPVFNLMKLKQDWTMVYQDECYGLFARTGSDLASKLADANKDLPTPPAYFP